MEKLIIWLYGTINNLSQGHTSLFATTQSRTHRKSSKKTIDIYNVFYMYIEHISDSLRKKERKLALLYQ